MKTSLLSMALFALLGTAAHAGETHPATVVELFTSQGCSSCPPADRLVTAIADEEDILALSYGVTYWDYLGWSDTFGDPQYSQRQRDYNGALGYPGAYTPEIILNGAVHNSRYAKAQIAQHRLPADRQRLYVSKAGDGKLSIRFDDASPYQLSVVRFTPGSQQVPVKRGENGGRTLTISNVVTELQQLDFNSNETVTINEDAMAAGDEYALILQEPNFGPIVTAVRYAP